MSYTTDVTDQLTEFFADRYDARDLRDYSYQAESDRGTRHTYSLARLIEVVCFASTEEQQEGVWRALQRLDRAGASEADFQRYYQHLADIEAAAEDER